MIPDLRPEGIILTTREASPVIPKNHREYAEDQLETNERPYPLFPLGKGFDVKDQKRDSRGDPARYDRVAEQMVEQIHQVVEDDHGEGHLEGHAERLGHQRDGTQINHAHEKALREVGHSIR